MLPLSTRTASLTTQEGFYEWQAKQMIVNLKYPINSIEFNFKTHWYPHKNYLTFTFCQKYTYAMVYACCPHLLSKMSIWMIHHRPMCTICNWPTKDSKSLTQVWIQGKCHLAAWTYVFQLTSLMLYVPSENKICGQRLLWAITNRSSS
jgi:hypothetical protein